MTISMEDVEHIAELARLGLTDEEKARFRDQLSAILDSAARLQKIDTTGIPATASVLPLDSVLREDIVDPPQVARDLLANAVDQDADMFRVRVVLE